MNAERFPGTPGSARMGSNGLTGDKGWADDRTVLWDSLRDLGPAWHAFTLDESEDAAAARFLEKHGAHSERIFEDKGLLLLGTIPEAQDIEWPEPQPLAWQPSWPG